jgi:16S rRNA (adenine1518-N6/adenine1519-N6)-dimethyltransferase
MDGPRQGNSRRHFAAPVCCMTTGHGNLKKSLGQHFLQDENVCRKIVDALRQHPFEQLLEVGPGAGALTKYLLQMDQVRFKAVEIDPQKVAFLSRTYPALRDRLIQQDFLTMDRPFEGKFTVVGNFPYNISTEILFRMLDWKDSVECMIGMFQKEVARRIASGEGSKVYGVVSVLVQAFFEVEYLFEVAETCFYPPPKVKSAVVRLTPKKQYPAMRSERDFNLLVRKAFNQRRKTLRNAVKDLFTEEVLKSAIFEKRAEQLTVMDFARLTHMMK